MSMLFANEIDVVVIFRGDLGILAEEMSKHSFFDNILHYFIDVLSFENFLGFYDFFLVYLLVLVIFIKRNALNVG